MTKIFFVLLFCTLTGGCLGYKPFQPPPDESHRWKKMGASEDAIVMALLECGHPYPRGYSSGYTKMISTDEATLTASCMEGDGFISTVQRSSWRGWCDSMGKSASLACNPDAPIPKRDPNKRFNSLFCRELPKAKVCQP